METEKEEKSTIEQEVSDSDKIEAGEKSVVPFTRLQVLMEYREICKRYPVHKGHRKGIKKELEKLAYKYPGAVFPGSHKIKTETTQYGLRLKALAENLAELSEKYLHKKHHSMNLPKTAVRILIRLNDSDTKTGRELVAEEGVAIRTLSRAIQILVKLRLAGKYLRGKYHFYAITESGKNFLKGAGKAEN